MDSKADQPLLDPVQRGGSYIHTVTETKDFSEKDPKLYEIEHIELRDADAPLPTTIDAGQGETIEVKSETVTKKETKEKMSRSAYHTDSPPLTVGLNMFDRDEKNINGQVHIMFDDVMAEPDSAHSFDAIWRGTFVLFYWTKLWMYRLLTLVVALPLAVVWGILFAIATIVNVYIFTPFFKLFAIFFQWIGALWSTLLRELVGPIFEAFGRCFTNIRFARGEATTVATNTPPKPTMNNASVGPVVNEKWNPVV